MVLRIILLLGAYRYNFETYGDVKLEKRNSWDLNSVVLCAVRGSPKNIYYVNGPGKNHCTMKMAKITGIQKLKLVNIFWFTNILISISPIFWDNLMMYEP